LISGLSPSAARSAEGLALGPEQRAAAIETALSLRALRRDAVRETRGCITGCGPEPIFSCRGNPEPIGKVS
jgi:hypothetical protein